MGTVQALLGHSSPEINREVYLHSIPADARTAVEKVEDSLNALSPRCKLMGRGRRRSVCTFDEVRPFLSLTGNARFEPIYVAPPSE